MSSNSHYVAERAFRQCLDRLHYKVVYYPVPGLMDVCLDPCCLTGPIPVVFSVDLWGELCSLAAQKQGDGRQVDLTACGQFEVHVKGGALLIELNPFFIEVAPQQDHGFLRETDGFDPSPSTAFTKGFRFVFHAKCRPIREH